jgi:hypothetical protein
MKIGRPKICAKNTCQKARAWDYRTRKQQQRLHSRCGPYNTHTLASNSSAFDRFSLGISFLRDVFCEYNLLLHLASFLPMSCLDKTNANFMRVLKKETTTENYVLIAALT